MVSPIFSQRKPLEQSSGVNQKTSWDELAAYAGKQDRGATPVLRTTLPSTPSVRALLLSNPLVGTNPLFQLFPTQAACSAARWAGVGNQPSIGSLDKRQRTSGPRRLLRLIAGSRLEQVAVDGAEKVTTGSVRANGAHSNADPSVNR